MNHALRMALVTFAREGHGTGGWSGHITCEDSAYAMPQSNPPFRADVVGSLLHTLADDPHLQAVALVEHIHHPSEGEVRAIRPTVILDNQRPHSGVPAREIGADTRHVLARAGFSETEITDLLTGGAGDAPQDGAR